MPHTCHATGCNVPVPPRLLMCRKHWFMVPKSLRDRVWQHYRPGQEIDKQPSRAYLAVMIVAIRAVEERERFLHGLQFDTGGSAQEAAAGH